MIKKIEKFLYENNIKSNNIKILLAVSGGIDSMTMINCFQKLKFKISIAHCNFKLRGNESYNDMLFVKNFSIKNNIIFYCNSFNTVRYAQINKISNQMSARYLRYNWFHFIASKYQYDYIATAHHASDALETFLINFIKGANINGLSGIMHINKNIIRPMILCTKNEIIEYADKHDIKYREDKSNNNNYYWRNLLRNKVIPILKTLNPSLEITSFKTYYNIIKAKNLIKNTNYDIIVKIDKNTYYIYLKDLRNDINYFIVYKFLYKCNFNFKTIYNIINYKYQSGKYFKTKNYILTYSNDRIIIHNNAYDSIKLFNKRKTLQISIIDNIGSVIFNKSKFIEYFDFDKLNMPLKLRYWNYGDKFVPLGCEYNVKLSDFFINNKILNYKKKEIPILTSNEQIIWIIGYRINNNFKLTKYSKKICIVQYNPII